MKKYLGTIGVNALKIWGASWIGFLVEAIPSYIMRFQRVTEKIQNIVSGVICGIAAMVALFIFFKWEGRKREFHAYTTPELILVSAAPALLWAIIGCVFVGNNFLVLTCVVPLCGAVTGIEQIDYTFFTPLPFALLFAVFYAVAIFLGYWYGRKHQKW